MKFQVVVLAAISALALAGCGQTRGERALSGGLLGAGAGAGVAAITGGSLLTGGVIGGLGGAAAGALTGPSDVNLGRPAWRR
jgi:hypothetical protein